MRESTLRSSALFIGLLIMLCMKQTLLNAQAPQLISYQAVVRDAGNSVISNATIGMRISILQDSSAGTVVYQEQQNPQTNSLGLITIKIGGGNVVSGSMSAINWNQHTHFIKTEVDPNGGSNYSIIGVTQLLSVPYALSSGDNHFTSSGSHIYSNNTGNIGIGNSSPSEKLDVLGKTKTSSLQITSGANQGYVMQSDASGNGSWVNPSSLSVTTGLNYVGNSYLGKTSGFGGTGTNEGGNNLSNVFIGNNTGLVNDGGIDNIGLGSNSLVSNTFGTYNIGIGRYTLGSNIDGGNNTAIGTYSLRFNSNGGNNTALGYSAGYYATGSSNVFLGNNAGFNNEGSSNVFIGNEAGKDEIGSNKLYIDNSSTTTPLILGNFSTNKVSINDSLESKYFKLTNGATNAYLLQSDATGNGTWVNSSSLPIVSSLSTNYLTKWNGLKFTNGLLYDDGTRLVMGTTFSNFGNNFSYSGFTIAATSTSNSDISLLNSENAQFASYLNFGKARGASMLSPDVVLNNDQLMVITANGYSGSGYLPSATINAEVDGTPTLTSVPGRIIFKTTQAGNSGSAERVRITSSGNVGIATTAPSEKLEVNGKTKTTNLQVTNGATNGYVLQSDASGNSTWVNPTTLSNGNWTTIGTNQYNALSGNVGIGTASPSRPLHVVGTSQYITEFSGSNNVGTWAAFKNTTTGGDTWSLVSTGVSNSEGAGAFLISSSTIGTRLTINSSGYMGIGTNAPNATLHVNGSMNVKRTAVSAGTTIGATDNIHLLAVTTTAATTVVLPSASTVGAGREYIIKSETSTANITITPAASQTIDGSASKTITTGYGVIRIYSNGSNWFTY